MSHTPETVRAKVEESIAAHAKSQSRFSWPDDSIWTEPWAYYIHDGWVGAWNAEDRKTPSIQFLREWLADDEHILVAFERAADFANGNGWPTKPGQSELRHVAAALRAAGRLP